MFQCPFSGGGGPLGLLFGGGGSDNGIGGQGFGGGNMNITQMLGLARQILNALDGGQASNAF